MEGQREVGESEGPRQLGELVNSRSAELFWHTARVHPGALPRLLRHILGGTAGTFLLPDGVPALDGASLPRTGSSPDPRDATRSSRLPPAVRVLRPHQWLKNVLVFVPLLAGQRLGDVGALASALLAFAAFSLTASTVYVVNDLLDLGADRAHPTKRARPFASGALPIRAGALLVPGLLTGAALCASGLPSVFWGVLAGYLILTFAYSLKLKETLLIDVVTLAGLYTIRVLAGSAATGVEPSVWLLGFSLFFFLSLALLKRYAELHQAATAQSTPSGGRLPGRGYQVSDLPVLVALGVGTGCVAVLVLALYLISDEVAQHYSRPWLVWQLCPLLVYWIGRAWIVVSRDEMEDDPVVWAVSDDLSRWTAILGVVLLLVAR